MHIVPDALGNGLPFQLGEHRRDIHHGAAHGRGRVKLLADGDEVDVPVAQILDELGKVADVAADAVEAVDHDGGKGDLLGVLHHFLELRALQIAAGKALILVDQHIFRRFLAKVHGDVLAAKLDLVLDALALTGEFGLAGIDDVLLRLWLALHFHNGTSRRFVSLIENTAEALHLQRGDDKIPPCSLLSQKQIMFAQNFRS